MQITDDQVSESSLAVLGAEAVQLLCSGDIPGLADRFGYALALGREPVAAILEDLASCLSELQATGLAQSTKHAATVKYFEPNDSSIVAIVECRATTINRSDVLLELVVTHTGAGKHVTLEQLSAAA